MITIRIAGNRYYPNTFVFPGGEVSVKLPEIIPIREVQECQVKAKITNSNDLMELLLAKNALDVKYGPIRYVLLIPYLPYARQDRVCNDGEALSIKVMVLE